MKPPRARLRISTWPFIWDLAVLLLAACSGPDSTPQPAETPTETASIETVTDVQKQSEILNLVNNQRGALPAELLLAIIRQEGGEGAFHVDGWRYNSFYSQSDGPWAQPTNGDGVMQVTVASGYHQRSGPYTSDAEGYNHAIEDGASYLKEFDDIYGSLVQATLHYNSGPQTLYIYLGRNQGDRNYLSRVAIHLDDSVSNAFGLMDAELVEMLYRGHTILTDYLENKGIAPGKTVDYYRPYQEQLDRDLRNISLGAPSTPSRGATPILLRNLETSPQGPEWVALYDGRPDNRNDAYAIAVDNEGNVLVTGRLQLGQQGREYIGTIKYDNSGREVWVKWQAGQPEPERLRRSSAYGTVIAVDEEGSVHVGGFYAGESENGWVLAKYDAEGRRLWVTKKPNNSRPPVAIAVDEQGNSFMIGSQIDGADSQESDFIVVKYSPEGILEWSLRHGQDGDSRDTGVSAAIDKSGRVFVTGISTDLGQNGYRSHLVTVAYSSGGDLLWVSSSELRARLESYSNFSSRVVGDNGILVVLSAGCYGGLQRLSLSLDDGQVLSEQIEPDPCDPTIQTAAVVLGPDGFAYISGIYKVDRRYEQVTLKFDSEGRMVWTVRHPDLNRVEASSLTDFVPAIPKAIAVDRAHNVHVVGNSPYSRSSQGYATVKIGADGQKQWVAFYEGQPTSQDVAYEVALDSQGRLYAAIYSEGWEECQVFRYDAEGRGELLARHAGYRGGRGEMMALDQQGHVYLLCPLERQIIYAPEEHAVNQYLLARHDADGVMEWSVELSLGGEDEGKVSRSHIVGMIADEAGNLFLLTFDEVEIRLGVPQGGSGFRLFKYSPQGQLLWKLRKSTQGQVFEPRFLKMYPRGHVLVIGSVLTKPGDEDSRVFSVVQYDPEGKELWVAETDFGGRDIVNAVVIDPQGNIYMTGHVGLGVPDIGTVKYDPKGNVLWTGRYDGGMGDTGDAITVDSDGNVYVSGWSYPSEITIMYTPDGREAWARQHQIRPRQMFTTSDGIPVLVGITLPGSDVDTANVALVAFDQTGEVTWVALYDGGMALSEWSVARGGSGYGQGGRYVSGYGQTEDSGISYEGSFRIYRTISDQNRTVFVAGYICNEVIELLQRCQDDALILKFSMAQLRPETRGVGTFGEVVLNGPIPAGVPFLTPTPTPIPTPLEFSPSY